MEDEVKRNGRFVGFIEPYDYGWRASFRTLRPGEIFSQEGESAVFRKEAEAVKWLHAQAGVFGFSEITIRQK